MIKQTENNKDATPRHRRRYSGALFIIIFLVFGLIVFGQHEAVKTIDCTPETIASKPDIIMLGAWWCSYCYQAKRYFQQKNIHYCEYDMENTSIGKQLYQKHGAGAVPILLIGQYQLNGFSERQVETTLSLLNKSRSNNIPDNLE